MTKIQIAALSGRTPAFAISDIIKISLIAETGQLVDLNPFIAKDDYNINGINEKTDYLKDLGINALYLTPLFKSPSTHKYDFEDIRQKGEASKYYSWYKIHQTPVILKPKPSYEDAGIYYIPKLNHDFPEVVDYLKKIIRYWTNKGIDGWRFDMPWCIPPEVVNILIKEAKRVNQSITVVGETWEQPNKLLKNYRFDGPMDYIVRNSVIHLLNQKISSEAFQETLNYKTK